MGKWFDSKDKKKLISIFENYYYYLILTVIVVCIKRNRNLNNEVKQEIKKRDLYFKILWFPGNQKQELDYFLLIINIYISIYCLHIGQKLSWNLIYMTQNNHHNSKNYISSSFLNIFFTFIDFIFCYKVQESTPHLGTCYMRISRTSPDKCG
jgi:hypothetical protein